MPFETTSVFDVLAADDTDRRVASRQALALAHTRVDNHLGRFLRAAVTTEEFEARLAAVKDEFASYVADACIECGHDHPERIASSLVDHYSDQRKWQPRGVTAAPLMAPPGDPGMASAPPGIGGMAQATPMPAPAPPTGPPQIPSMMGPPAGGQPPQGGQGGQTPAMEQAQNMMAQGPQAPSAAPPGGFGGMATVPPQGAQAGGMAPDPVAPSPGQGVVQDPSLMGGLPALQGSSSGRFLAPRTAVGEDPWSQAVQYYRQGLAPHPAVQLPDHPNAQNFFNNMSPEQSANFQSNPDMMKGYAGPYDVGSRQASDPSSQQDDSSKLVTCPECGGTKKQANGDACPKCHGKGQVPNFGDSLLDHVAKLADSGNTGLGKPEPTINKKKWTPQSLDQNPDPESKRNPTERKDIVEVIKAENRDQDGHDLKEIGEQTTEHVDLPAAEPTDHGFYDGGQTKGTGGWSTGPQADPVTKTTQ